MLNQRIRRAREEAALNQAELAERVGVTVRALAFWESGDREPRSHLLRKLAEATGKPLPWFFSENGEEAAA